MESGNEYAVTPENVFHPLHTRLFRLGSKKLSEGDVSFDYAACIANIENSFFQFDESDVMRHFTRALKMIEDIDVDEIELIDDPVLPWSINKEETNQSINKELSFYKTAIDKMVATLRIGDDDQATESRVAVKVDRQIHGIIVHAVADTRAEQDRKIEEFCRLLQESNFFIGENKDLVRMAFTGQVLPRKIDWHGQRNALGFLVSTLINNSGGQRYISRTIGEPWKAICDAFTVRRSELKPSSLKNNIDPDDETKDEILEIVSTLHATLS